jgi:Ca2+-binding RTX toxin-like protein
MAVLVGTVARNNLVGTADADTITGLAGADTLRGAGGADRLDGGVGDDVIVLNTGDVVTGERLIGGTGLDTLFADSAVDLSSAAEITGIEVLLLDTNAPVTLTGSQLAGFAAVRASGGAAWNLQAATAGSYDFRNTVLGSNVAFLGTAMADSIQGGAAGETFRGAGGADTIDAGDGRDTVVLSAGDVVAGERLRGGEGFDTLRISGNVDISAATEISGFELLELDSTATVTLTAAQLSGFTAVEAGGAAGWKLLAAVPGTYDFRATALGRQVGFLGSADADRILGGAGGEAFRGAGGADTIDAGDGRDTVVINTGDVVAGERLSGGEGIDTLFADSSVNITQAALIAGFEILELDALAVVTLTAAQLKGFREVEAQGAFAWNLLASAAGTYDFRNTALGSQVGFQGTAMGDRIIGGAAAEAFLGAGGADTIDGGDGDDTVALNTGDVVTGERLSGGAGRDTLFADSSVDLSSAAVVAGFEVLALDATSTVMLGAAQLRSFKVIEAQGAFGWKLLASVAGTYDFRNTRLDDDIGFLGSSSADRIIGGAADEIFRGGAGADTIDGGAGDDRIVLNGGELAAGERMLGGAGADTLFADSSVDLSVAGQIAGIEQLRLDAGSIVMLTGAQVEAFRSIVAEGAFAWNLHAAAAGTYDFRGIAVGDRVGFLGSNGSDSIRGGASDEAFRGGTGADTIDGGAGDDVIVLNGGDVAAGERLAGGAGRDTLFADSSVDITAAAQTSGFELLLIDNGAVVTLNAVQLRAFRMVDSEGAFAWNLQGAGTGSFDLRSTTMDSTVGFIATAGADSLLAGAAADRLNGGGGADTINGGDGGDRLVGGTGDDVFVFQAGQADGDEVLDFAGAGAAGGDQLRFQGFGANATLVHVSGTVYEIRVGGTAVEAISVVTGGATVQAQDWIFV